MQPHISDESFAAIKPLLLLLRMFDKNVKLKTPKKDQGKKEIYLDCVLDRKPYRLIRVFTGYNAQGMVPGKNGKVYVVLIGKKFRWVAKPIIRPPYFWSLGGDDNFAEKVFLQQIWETVELMFDLNKTSPLCLYDPEEIGLRVKPYTGSHEWFCHIIGCPYQPVLVAKKLSNQIRHLTAEQRWAETNSTGMKQLNNLFVRLHFCK